MKLKRAVPFFFLFVLYSWNVKAQHESVIDTLEIYSDHALVQYQTFKDSSLISDSHALIFNSTLTVQRFRFTHFFKKTINAQKLLFHGKSISYLSDGRYRIGFYQNGKKYSMTYFSSDSLVITRNEFYENRVYIDTDPENGEFYIISDNK